MILSLFSTYRCICPADKPLINLCNYTNKKKRGGDQGHCKRGSKVTVKQGRFVSGDILDRYAKPNSSLQLCLNLEAYLKRK